MKLKDLMPECGDVIQNKFRTGMIMENEKTRELEVHFTHDEPRICPLEYFLLDECWSLLQPAPVLGEAFPIEDFDQGDRVIARSPEGNWLTDGKCIEDGLEIAFLEDNGCVFKLGSVMSDDYKLYFAPKLPLPPEPSLREKILEILNKRHALNRDDKLADELAALLGGSHE